MRLFTAAIPSLAISCCVFVQIYAIKTFAGGGPLSVPRPAPNSVVVDRAGSLFFVEEQVVQRLDATTDLLTLVAGNSPQGYTCDHLPATEVHI